MQNIYFVKKYCNYSGSKFRGSRFKVYMKIPPSHLYQRGVRGDFHASLWQQAMGVRLINREPINREPDNLSSYEIF